MDDLPSEFDVIVVGTGLSESILSAAASRNGHTVLHLDPSEYYGGKWATLNWDQLDSDLLSKSHSMSSSEISEKDLKSISEISITESPAPSIKADDVEIQFQRTNCIRNFERCWYIADETSDDEKAKISKLSRKFNIDIYPKVVQAREEIIQLLIDSNVSRYLEFKCIPKLFVSLPPPLDTVIEPVPLSRSDIFTSTSLGLVEKRKLTKFIDLILKSSSSQTETEDAETVKPPTVDYQAIVKASGVTDKIQHLIQTAVKNIEDAYDVSLFQSQFVDKFRLFLQSIGRYGNQTPYLWTLYGVGEICQAFCRLSAIYGGIFILKRSVQSVTVNDKNSSEETPNSSEKETEKDEPPCESTGANTHPIVVTTDDMKIKAKFLVLGSDVKPKSKETVEKTGEVLKTTRTVGRGILLTIGGRIKRDKNVAANSDDSAVDTPNENETHMSVYKIGNFEIIEVDNASLAVPEPYRLLHVSYPYLGDHPENNGDPKTVIENGLEPFLDFGNTDAEPETTDKEVASDKPAVLFGAYFLVDFVDREKTGAVESQVLHDKILYCTTKSTGITGEIFKAKKIFNVMFPGEDFLPKAPDAEAESGGGDGDGDGELEDSFT